MHYLNTLPLIEGLNAWSGADLIMDIPSALVGRLERREIDLGLLSLIDGVRSQTPLTLLPVGMIGSDGPTHTVRVYSRVPVEQITTLHADTDSHTSVVLAQIILNGMHGVRPVMEPFAARTSASDPWPETVLLIGDKVVREPPPADDFPHRVDLGAAWREWTGLPFVYATWMCRSEDAARPEILDAMRVLERQRLHNATRMEWLVRTHAPEREWDVEEAATYVGSNLRYSVGEREREAIARFLSEASALGLAPSDASPRWIDA